MRLLILLWYPAVSSDVHLYLAYAVRGVDLGQVPYRDFTVEYPPLAYGAVALPRLVDPTPYPANELTEAALGQVFPRYRFLFRLEMAILDALAFWLFVGTVRLRRPGAEGLAAWGYTLCGLVLAPLLYDRLDGALLFLLMLWAYACARSLHAGADSWRWAVMASLALGLGVACKWVPVVAAPFFWWGFGRGWRMRLLTGSVLTASALLPFALHGLSAGNGVWWFLQFHQQRGLEVESLWASLLLATQFAGVAWSAVQGPGSWDLAGPWADRLAHGSTLLLLASYAGLAVWLWARGRRRGAGASGLATSGFRLALLVLLLTGGFAKVLSPQYLIWLLPVLLLAGAETLDGPRLRRLVMAAVLLGAVSSWLYPYHFLEFRVSESEAVPNAPTLLVGLGDVRAVDPALAAVLLLRNLLLAGVIVRVAIGLLRSAPAEGDETAPPSQVMFAGAEPMPSRPSANCLVS